MSAQAIDAELPTQEGKSGAVPRLFLDLVFEPPLYKLGLARSAVRSVSADEEEVDVIDLADRFSLRENRLLFHSIRMLSVAELAKKGLAWGATEDALRSASAFLLYPTFSAEGLESATQLPHTRVSAVDILAAIVLSRYAVENGDAIRKDLCKDTRKTGKWLAQEIAVQTSAQLELLGAYIEMPVPRWLVGARGFSVPSSRRAAPAPSLEIGTLAAWILVQMNNTPDMRGGWGPLELEFFRDDDPGFSVRKALPLSRAQPHVDSIEFNVALEDREIALLVPTLTQLASCWDRPTLESKESAFAEPALVGCAVP